MHVIPDYSDKPASPHSSQRHCYEHPPSLVLAGLLGLGCPSEHGAISHDMPNGELHQGQSGATLVPPARLAANRAASSEAGAPEVAVPRIDGIRFRRYTEPRE